jgi:hypothetical protein
MLGFLSERAAPDQTRASNSIAGQQQFEQP